MSTMEQPQDSTVENIEGARLEHLRSHVEKKVTEFVSQADSHLYVKATIVDNQMLVELFKDKRHVFNGYSVVDPLLVEKKNGEGYIIANAIKAMSYWLEDPHEGLKFGQPRESGKGERKVA